MYSIGSLRVDVYKSTRGEEENTLGKVPLGVGLSRA